MNEEKYYTPEIEEFHVGFEFESDYVLFRNDAKGDEWNKVTMSEEEFCWFHNAYNNDAVKTEFRVKYLDQEDIESLGWEFVKEFKTYSTFKLKESNNSKFPENHLLFSKRGITIESYDEDGHDYTRFFGEIKNKSELKQIMKMLNI